MAHHHVQAVKPKATSLGSVVPSVKWDSKNCLPQKVNVRIQSLLQSAKRKIYLAHGPELHVH
jgi:hypothetical protein